MDLDQCLYSGSAHYPVYNVLKTAFRDGRDCSCYDGMYYLSIRVCDSG